MASPTMVADQPNSERSASTSAYALPHPVVLGPVSGLMLWFSFPPLEWSWAAWVALVPLFLLVMSDRSRKSIYLGAWLGGFVFWLLAIHWVWATDPSAWLGWIVMALFLSTWWPGFVFLGRFGLRSLRLPLIIGGPLFWVALEYFRAHVLTGFPWYFLAHSQYRQVYLTQIADFSGSLGLSFLMAMCNAFVVELLVLPLLKPNVRGTWWVRLALPQRVRLIVVGLSLASTVAYGVFRVESARFRPGPRIALLQTNDLNGIDADQKRKPDQIQADIEALIGRAKRSSPPPDLIVWPETANPWSYYRIDPRLDRKTLDALVKQEYDPQDSAERWLTYRDTIEGHFAALMDGVGIPMMVGTSIYEMNPSGYFRFNAAVLFRPRLPIQIYRKLHLVPFGEYVPLLKQIPWLIKLTPFSGPNIHFLDHGQDPAWFDLGPYRLATAICFEDTVPHVVRRFFAEAPGGRQPDVLVNLSNDGWFQSTSEHEMHLAVSVFRCIENRVPLARAVNTGVSAMIDGNGRILKSLAKLQKGVLIEIAPLDDRISLYSRWGDWLGLSCVASTIGLVIMGVISPRLPRRRLKNRTA